MAAPEQLPTLHRELIGVSTLMIFLSTVFTVWRIFVRYKVSHWMGWSDWLMIVGAVSNKPAQVLETSQ